jgi:ribonuclease D
MHGCVNSDVWWLARDFGIRVVNVFDTQEYEKYLTREKQSKALTHLWTRYCEGYPIEKLIEEKDKF